MNVISILVGAAIFWAAGSTVPNDDNVVLSIVRDREDRPALGLFITR